MCDIIYITVEITFAFKYMIGNNPFAGNMTFLRASIIQNLWNFHPSLAVRVPADKISKSHFVYFH